MRTIPEILEKYYTPVKVDPPVTMYVQKTASGTEGMKLVCICTKEDDAVVYTIVYKDIDSMGFLVPGYEITCTIDAPRFHHRSAEGEVTWIWRIAKSGNLEN